MWSWGIQHRRQRGLREGRASGVAGSAHSNTHPAGSSASQALCEPCDDLRFDLEAARLNGWLKHAAEHYRLCGQTWTSELIRAGARGSVTYGLSASRRRPLCRTACAAGTATASGRTGRSRRASSGTAERLGNSTTSSVPGARYTGARGPSERRGSRLSAGSCLAVASAGRRRPHVSRGSPPPSLVAAGR